MLSSIVPHVRARMALRLAALCFLFPTIASSYPSGGNPPNIKLYYSFDKVKGGPFILRGVELRSPLKDEPIYPCGFNNNPETDYCATSFTCGVGINPGKDSPETIHFAYRATDRQIYDAMVAKIGQEIKVFIGGQCMIGSSGVAKNELMILSSSINKPAPVVAQVWGTGSTESIPPEPEIDPQCKVNDSIGKVAIEYDTILSTDVSGAGGVRSGQLNVRCEQDAAMKISMINELSLRPDLSALLYFKKSGLTEVPGAEGVIATMKKGETTAIEVISKLKASGEVEGGPFSGSTVIKLEYF